MMIHKDTKSDNRLDFDIYGQDKGVILDVLFLEKGMRLLYCGIRFISEQYNTNEFSASS
jgi:hypothetical protein